jgi:hypothetical protein
MFKKMLALAFLLPGLGGCIWSEGGGRHEGHHEHHGSVEITPVHLNCVGCRHVYRGGVWVDAD